MPAAHRAEICRMAGAAGVAVIENDIYSELAYEGNFLAPAQTAGFERHSAGQFFENRVPRHPGRMDHRASPRDRTRDGTEAARRPAYRPSFAGFPAAFCGVGKAGAASGDRDRGSRQEKLRVAFDQSVPPISFQLHVESSRWRHEYVDPVAAGSGCVMALRGSWHSRLGSIICREDISLRRGRSIRGCGSVSRVSIPMKFAKVSKYWER